MKTPFIYVSTGFFLIFFTSLYAGTPLKYATIEDGTRIIISDNKTWQYPSANKNIKTPEDAVTGRGTLTHEDEGEYEYDDKKSVQISLEFRNNTESEIVGIISDVIIENIFGKPIFKDVFEQEIDLPEGSNNFVAPSTYIYFEKGFRDEGVYHDTFSAAVSGKYKLRVIPRTIIFANGSKLEKKTSTSLQSSKKKKN